MTRTMTTFKDDLLEKLKEIDQKNQDHKNSPDTTEEKPKPKRSQFVPPPRPPGMFTDEEWRIYLGYKRRFFKNGKRSKVQEET